MAEITWEQCKQYVSRLSDPHIERVGYTSGSHDQGSEKHDIKRFVYDAEYGGWPLQFVWGLCERCSEVRYAYWMAINNKKNLVHLHKTMDLAEIERKSGRYGRSSYRKGASKLF